MPTFPTPRPITAFVEAAAGSVRLVATDSDETVVEVRRPRRFPGPRRPGRRAGAYRIPQ